MKEKDDRIALSAISRDEWVRYQWLNGTHLEDSEPMYYRGVIRPIEECERAAREYDSIKEANA